MIRQHNHYHLWKLVRKLEWHLFKKGKGVATGATRQGIPEFPHLSTGMLDEQCLPAVNLHSRRGFGWFVMIPAYLLLCFIPSLRVREWGCWGLVGPMAPILAVPLASKHCGWRSF